VVEQQCIGISILRPLERLLDVLRRLARKSDAGFVRPDR
jgi:hypothetical protein